MFQQHSIYDFRCAHTCKCQISKEAKIIFLSSIQINVFINNRMYASAASGSIQILTEIITHYSLCIHRGILRKETFSTNSSVCLSYLVIEGFRTFPKKESKLLNIHLKIQAQLNTVWTSQIYRSTQDATMHGSVWKVPRRQRVQKTHLAQQNATQNTSPIIIESEEHTKHYHGATELGHGPGAAEQAQMTPSSSCIGYAQDAPNSFDLGCSNHNRQKQKKKRVQIKVW